MPRDSPTLCAVARLLALTLKVPPRTAVEHAFRAGRVVSAILCRAQPGSCVAVFKTVARRVVLLARVLVPRAAFVHRAIRARVKVSAHSWTLPFPPGAVVKPITRRVLGALALPPRAPVLARALDARLVVVAFGRFGFALVGTAVAVVEAVALHLLALALPP